MPNYSYKAIDDNGRVSRGTFVAFSEEDIENRLQQRGLTLIKCKQLRESAWAKQLVSGKVKPRILIELYHRLAQTLELGLSLVASLDENAKLLPSKPLKKVLEETRAGLEGGNTLYESMSRFPHVFQKLDLTIIKMGEQSGVLPQCLRDLADFLEWKEDIRSTIKRAAIYPTFIIVALTAVVGVWVGYVLPQMATMLTDMGIELPDITQIVFKTSLFIQSNWLWMLGSIFFSVIFLYLFQKTENGGIIFHKYLLKIPIIGSVVMNIAVARLSHNFSIMFRSGMVINHIFEILINNVLGNRYLETQLGKAFHGVQRGQSIANAFESAGGFPPLLMGGIKTGETTGTLDAAFGRLGDYYDAEVKRTVQAMISAIEPATIIFLGGVFGMIALSIMLPLYDIIGSLGDTY